MVFMHGFGSWPADEAGRPETPVPVLSAISPLDADMKGTLLGAFGVPVWIARSVLDDRFSASFFGNYLAAVDLLVPIGRREEALALLVSDGGHEEA